MLKASGGENKGSPINSQESQWHQTSQQHEMLEDNRALPSKLGENSYGTWMLYTSKLSTKCEGKKIQTSKWKILTSYKLLSRS